MTTCVVTAAIPRTIDLFLGPHIKRMRELGFQVHIASSGKPDVVDEQNLQFTNIGFMRSPLNLIAHYRAWKEYRALIDKLSANNEPVLLHLHTPIAATLARLAVRRTHPTRVLYMAHGFHFLPGEKNLYYWIERLMARYTDLYVVINDDDAVSANKLSHGDSSRWAKIPGVGLQRITSDEKLSEVIPDDGQLSSSPPASTDDMAITSPSLRVQKRKRKSVIVVGVLEPRKHPELAIQAAAALDDDVDVYMVGDGPMEAQLREMAESLGCAHRVHFEGWTDNVKHYFSRADCLLFLSEREGLPMSVVEAVAAEIAVVAFDIRGVRDLLHKLNGWHVPDSRSASAVAAAITAALNTDIDRDAYQQRANEFTLQASEEAHLAAVKRLVPAIS